MLQSFENTSDQENDIIKKGAKETFTDALNAYINKFNQWKIENIGYKISHWNATPGKAGIQRANAFLESMQVISNSKLADIEKSKALIMLTKKPQFRQGSKLFNLLKECTLTVAGFEQLHINIVAKQKAKQINISENELLYFYNYKDEVCQREAIENIYYHIIQSHDFGHRYLKELQKQSMMMKLNDESCNHNSIELETIVNYSA